MAKNNLTAKMQAREKRMFQLGGDQMTDFTIEIMLLTLQDETAMSGNPFGIERLARFADVFKVIHEKYIRAFISKDPEADYLREKLDENMRTIYGENFKPFEERYPLVRDIKY